MKDATFNRIKTIAQIFHAINQGDPLTDRERQILRFIQLETGEYDRVLSVLRFLSSVDHQVSIAEIREVLSVGDHYTREIMRAIDYGFPLKIDDRGRSGYWYQPIEVGENLKSLMEAI